MSTIGIGYADLENRVPCTSETVMRIASVCKPLTSAAAARLCEEGKLDLDVPVQKYVPEFPQKQFDGHDVSNESAKMTCSHLCSAVIHACFVFLFFLGYNNLSYASVPHEWHSAL